MITAEPATPAIVAVIAAVPGLTAVARPDEPTVATPASDVVQTTVFPVTVPPEASFAVAVIWTVAPIDSSVCEDGATVTLATMGSLGVVGSSPPHPARRRVARTPVEPSRFMDGGPGKGGRRSINLERDVRPGYPGPFAEFATPSAPRSIGAGGPPRAG